MGNADATPDDCSGPGPGYDRVHAQLAHSSYTIPHSLGTRAASGNVPDLKVIR